MWLEGVCVCVCARACGRTPSPGYKKNSCVSNQVIVASCCSCLVYLVSPWKTNMSFHTWSKVWFSYLIELKCLSSPRHQKSRCTKVVSLFPDGYSSGQHRTRTCQEQRLIQRTLIAQADTWAVSHPNMWSPDRILQHNVSLPVWNPPPKKLVSTLEHIF